MLSPTRSKSYPSPDLGSAVEPVENRRGIQHRIGAMDGYAVKFDARHHRIVAAGRGK